MKKNTSLISVFLILASLSISCKNRESVKGNWSDLDKQKFTLKSDNNFNKSKFQKSYGNEHKVKLIECALQKAEEKYSNFDETDIDIVGQGELYYQCIKKILSDGSVIGRWSDHDKTEFIKGVDGLDKFKSGFLGRNKQKVIECYLLKNEAKYANFYESTEDLAAMKEISRNCDLEILSNGSVKGKWSRGDKKRFQEEFFSKLKLTDIGNSKNKWLKCGLDILEKRYSSYFEATQDVNFGKKIVAECFMF